MKSRILNLDQPLPEGYHTGKFFEELTNDVYAHFDELEKEIPEGTSKVFGSFQCHRVIHVENIKCAQIIYELFCHHWSARNQSRKPRLGYRRYDILSLVLRIDLKEPGVPVALPGLMELQRFKIKSNRYPITITFRTKLDAEDYDLEVLVVTPGWYFPGFGTLLHNNKSFTVEADIPCIMYTSSVLHCNDYSRDEMERKCQEGVYKNGFRPSIDLNSLIQDEKSSEASGQSLVGQ